MQTDDSEYKKVEGKSIDVIRMDEFTREYPNGRLLIIGLKTVQNYKKYQKSYTLHAEHDCKENKCSAEVVNHIQQTYAILQELVE